MTNALPPWKDHILPTPLHSAAADVAVSNEWQIWGSYSVARTYTSWHDEYDAIRRHAGLSELTPSVRYKIDGVDAGAYLNRLVTRDIALMPAGMLCVSPLCDDHGHVIDIARLERVDDNTYYLCPSAPLLPWLLDSAFGFEVVTITDVTGQDVILGLTGVASCAVLLLAGVKGIERLKPNHIGIYKMRDAVIVVARTGALGEMAYELRIIPRDALMVWDRLLRVGTPLGLKPVGMQARDMCRIEYGDLAFGQDYIGALAAQFGNRPRTPYELGLAAQVDMEKDFFIGKRALRYAAQKTRTKIAAFLCEGLDSVDHAKVLKQDRLIGTVTSSCWSPKVKSVIALATVTDTTLADGQTVSIDMPVVRELEPDHLTQTARVTQSPFYVSPARNATLRGT